MSIIIGRWRIIKMSEWDNDFIDLVEPGAIDFEKGGCGSFHFGAMYSQIIYQILGSKKEPSIDFVFSGQDEGDSVSGKGYLTLRGKQLHGDIQFFSGDESNIVLEKFF